MYNYDDKLRRQLEELDKKYSRKRIELERLHREQQASSIPEEVKKLVIVLHKKTCHYSHIDECSFDERDWSSLSNKEYVKKGNEDS